MTLILPAILYDNIFRDSAGTVSYSGAVTSGKEASNAYDWRDFSLFLAASGTSNLDYTAGGALTVDNACIYLADDVTGTIKAQVETGVGTGTYTDLASWVNPAAGVYMERFADTAVASGQKVRFAFESFSAAYNIRQLAIGPELRLPIGQRGDFSPPSLTGGFVVTNTIAVNGSIIGRTVRRKDRESELSIEYLTESYVRTTWESFATHAEGPGAFFYSWDPVNRPTEVTFASPESVNRPTNMNQAGYMSVNWPLRNLT